MIFLFSAQYFPYLINHLVLYTSLMRQLLLANKAKLAQELFQWIYIKRFIALTDFI